MPGASCAEIARRYRHHENETTALERAWHLSRMVTPPRNWPMPRRQNRPKPAATAPYGESIFIWCPARHAHRLPNHGALLCAYAGRLIVTSRQPLRRWKKSAGRRPRRVSLQMTLLAKRFCSRPPGAERRAKSVVMPIEVTKQRRREWWRWTLFAEGRGACQRRPLYKGPSVACRYSLGREDRKACARK